MKHPPEGKSSHAPAHNAVLTFTSRGPSLSNTSSLGFSAAHLFSCCAFLCRVTQRRMARNIQAEHPQVTFYASLAHAVSVWCPPIAAQCMPCEVDGRDGSSVASCTEALNSCSCTLRCSTCAASLALVALSACRLSRVLGGIATATHSVSGASACRYLFSGSQHSREQSPAEHAS